MAYFGGVTQRVKKIDAPLLVVGLGGTGADGVRRIKNEFAQRMYLDKLGERTLDRPPRTAYLVLDTDPGEVKKRYHGTSIDKDTEWVDLSWDVSSALDNNGANLTPAIRAWLDSRFYTDYSLKRDAATNGAGTYRQLSRMMLFRRAQDVLAKLQALLTQLSALPAGAPAGASKINIVVVTGLCGGTGSGSFLDFAYLVRHAAAMNNRPIQLDLYAVGPDVTINKLAVTDMAKKTIYQTNSFAALKELDYWMSIDRRTSGHVKEESVTVDYGGGLSIPWDQRPYDDVTLLCATNAQGVLLENAYDVVLASLTETLLFMMAEEDDSFDVVSNDSNHATTDDSYSFQSQRSNETAYRAQIHRPYPQNYCYRAIGAYSNLGEQRNKVSIEAQLLFKDEESFVMDPVNMPVMKGTAPEEFQEPMQTKLQLLLEDFCTATMIDTQMFSGITPYSRKEIAANDASYAPHGNLHANWLKNAQAQLAVLEGDFTQALRDQFTEMGKAYICQHGPDALRTILSAPDTGFIAWLRGKVSSFTAQKNDNRAAYNNYLAVSNQKFIELVEVSGNPLKALVQGTAIFDQYIGAVQSIYTAKQNELAMDVLGRAVEKLANDIQSQILDRNLKFTIEAIDQIRKDVDEDVRRIPASRESGHVVDMKELRQQIETAYYADDNQKKLLNTLLESAADTAIVFDDASVNAETAAANMIERLDSMISVVFNTINDMSLQRQLVSFNNDVNADGVDAYVKSTIAPQLERGAQVHFSLVSNYGGLNTTNAVVSSYISVPAGASQVRNGIKQYISTGQYSGSVIKSSAISDRIFWMNIVSGLPLCALSYLSQYEVTYESERLKKPGTHLVTMNEADLQKLNKKRTVLDDWNLLPSPLPFALLGADPAPQTIVQDLERKRADAEKTEKSGVLTLNIENGKMPAQYQARVAMFGTSDNPMTTEQVEAEIAAVLSGAADTKQKIEALDRLLSSRSTYDIVDDVRQDEQTERFSQALNLSGTYAADEKARQACFRELAYYRLSQRPGLMLELEKQIACAEKVADRIREIQEGNDQEAKVKQAAVKVARLQLYDCLKFRLTKVLYKNGLGAYDTNGTENLFFGQDMVQQQEPWVNFLPLQVKVVEWYAAQDQKMEPFPTLDEMVKEFYDKSLDPDDTPEDIQMCKDYQAKAEGIIKDIDVRIVQLKQQQKQIPSDEYNTAKLILDWMKMELQSLCATWGNL